MEGMFAIAHDNGSTAKPKSAYSSAQVPLSDCCDQL
jgi:hypothetical protein